MVLKKEFREDNEVDCSLFPKFDECVDEKLWEIRRFHALNLAMISLSCAKIGSPSFQIHMFAHTHYGWHRKKVYDLCSTARLEGKPLQIRRV